ncbi:MAG: aspartate carbamoyltransferase catalytic subunit [Bacillota bacterium]
MKGLLTLGVLPTEKIKSAIDLALEFKKGKSVSYSGKKMATLFFENSTRTQYSFQTAMINLGIQPLSFNASASSVVKGETLYDTVRTFESFGLDGVVIRHAKDRYYEELEGIKMPIFNGGDGASDHPTQNLLDLVTIYEEFGHFEGLKICIVGDVSHSRVAHGNADIMRSLGMEVFISGPDEFMDCTGDFIPFKEAVETMDVIMLLRVQFERHQEAMAMTVKEYHSKYGLTSELVTKMKKGAIIMHPAPINRGVEIADEVVECPASRIYTQMTNGVYARMAVISMVLDGKI